MDLERLKNEYSSQREDAPPQGYLADLESKVLARELKPKRRTIIRRIPNLMWAGAAAVTVVLLAVAQLMNSEAVPVDDILGQLPEDLQVEYYLATSDEDWWVDDEWMDDVTMEEYFEILDQQSVDDEVFENLY